MSQYKTLLITGLTAASLLLAACGSATTATVATNLPAQSTATTQAPTTAPAIPTAGVAVATVASSSTSAATTAAATVAPVPSAAATNVAAAQPAARAVTNLAVVSTDSTASYRVREQLAQKQLPSDAVGTTAVTGQIVLDSAGQVVPDASKLVVDMASLTSDSSRRDNFIKGNVLNAAKYPTATFVPTQITGLPSPLPTSGTQTFQLIGNMTIHGVTKPATWTVTAQVHGNDITGQATTRFTFEDYGMSPPRVAVVLSVDDNITVDAKLHLVKSG